MLFNSYIFIFLFFPLVLIGYYGLNYIKQYKLAIGYVTCMSLWFYGYNSMEYLIMLILSIIVNFILVEAMSHVKVQMSRKVLLGFGLLWNLGVLFYFKYYDFFIENVNAALKTEFTLLKLMLPLGISFYTFQQLSYVIDYYRGECEKYGFLEYAMYVSFFPQLIAGPIVYHDELIPQFRKEENKRLNYENLSKGIYAFSLGLAKKVLIADTFSRIVTLGFEELRYLNSPSTFLVMVCYSLQIYFDFSGYCDMAYGIGYMFNVELPLNFNSPYKAYSIMDFWDRWHMTLTRFFTKYVYIPLGGSRKGTVRTYGNVLLTFLISGLWHGANWTFILWGALNGLGSVIERWNISKKILSKIPKMIRVCSTFVVVTFLWSLFRAESIGQAERLWKHLFCEGYGEIFAPITEMFNDLLEMKILYRVGFGNVIEAYPAIFLILFIFLVVLACFFMKNTQEKVKAMKYSYGNIVTIVVLMVWSIMSLSEVSEFLYFNF